MQLVLIWVFTAQSMMSCDLNFWFRGIEVKAELACLDNPLRVWLGPLSSCAA